MARKTEPVKVAIADCAFSYFKMGGDMPEETDDGQPLDMSGYKSGYEFTRLSEIQARITIRTEWNVPRHFIVSVKEMY